MFPLYLIKPSLDLRLVFNFYSDSGGSLYHGSCATVRLLEYCPSRSQSWQYTGNRHTLFTSTLAPGQLITRNLSLFPIFTSRQGQQLAWKISVCVVSRARSPTDLLCMSLTFVLSSFYLYSRILISWLLSPRPHIQVFLQGNGIRSSSCQIPSKAQAHF